MNTEQIEAALKLADEAEVNMRKWVTIGYYGRVATTVSDLAASVHSLASALKQAQAERDAEHGAAERNSRAACDALDALAAAEAERDRYSEECKQLGEALGDQMSGYNERGERIRTLRDGLEFYADPTNWRIDDAGEWAFSRDELIDADPWEPARLALNP